MTDRELLEMAAKAAQIVTMETTSEVEAMAGLRYWDDVACMSVMWNPLVNDGDALRLAVRLGLQIQPYPLYAETKYAVLSHKGILVDGEPKYTHGFSCVYEGDPEGATRRAIVLAAADVGKEMP